MLKRISIIIVFSLVIALFVPLISGCETNTKNEKTIALQVAEDWTDESMETVADVIADLVTGLVPGVGAIPGVSGVMSSVIEGQISENISWTYSTPEKKGEGIYEIIAKSTVNIDLPDIGTYEISVDFPLTIDTESAEVTDWTVDTESFDFIDIGPSSLSVDFNGWYVGSDMVTEANKSDLVTVKINLSNGESGTYIIRVRRDISLSADETVVELSFSYDGTSAYRELSFIPPYATDESSTSGYYVDILKDSNTIWTMSSSYPPRLEVTNTSPTSLSINFDGWYVGSSLVTTANKSDTVIAKLTLSGGSTHYIMRIRRDISWASDETVKHLILDYDGSSVTVELSFTPPYATNESGTNGYHIDLLDGSTTTIWTMTDNYPPRLTVNS